MHKSKKAQMAPASSTDMKACLGVVGFQHHLLLDRSPDAMNVRLKKMVVHI